MSDTNQGTSRADTARMIRAPWTPVQVAALNAFQRWGGGHPFTCGGEHTPGSPVLTAREDGWHCSDPYGEGCDYTQDWAHASMADPGAWPKPPFGERHGPTPEEMRAALVPPADRAALSAKLWEIAEHHIVAEWVCCEPLEPRHDLCAKGYAALSMVKTLLVDGDPEKAWNPAAPLLDAVVDLMTAPVDRAAVLTEAADALERKFEGASLATIELRRLAAEATPEPATQDRPVAYRSYGTRALYCVICARQEDRCEPATQVDEKAACSFCGGNLLAVSSRTLGGVIAKYLEEAP